MDCSERRDTGQKPEERQKVAGRGCPRLSEDARPPLRRPASRLLVVAV